MTRLMRLRRRRRHERGAVAVLSAALVVVFLLLAALAVDIAQQVNKKHFLQNQLDAAATAAGLYVNNGDRSFQDAVDQAVTLFNENKQQFGSDYEWTDEMYAQISFWCIVRKEDGQAKASPESVRKNCNPDLSDDGVAYDAAIEFQIANYATQNRTMTVAGTTYNDSFAMSCTADNFTNGRGLCAIPCAINATYNNGWDPGLGGMRRSDGSEQAVTCNTIQVSESRVVEFNFTAAAGALPGQDVHSTGGVGAIAIACKGWCGMEPGDSLDVRYEETVTGSGNYETVCYEDGVKLDRCPDLFDAQDIVIVADRTKSMVDAVGGTSALRQGIKDLLTQLYPARQYVAFGTIGKSRTQNGCQTRVWNGSGTGVWIPTEFSRTYQRADGSLNINGDALAKSVDCMQDTTAEVNSGAGGTALAAPFKAAARELLSSGGIRTAERVADSRVQKVLILETDGTPQTDVATNRSASALSLNSSTDPQSNWTSNTVDSDRKYYRFYCSTNSGANQWLYSTSSGYSPASNWCASSSAYTTHTRNNPGRSVTYYYCDTASNGNYGEVRTSAGSSWCRDNRNRADYSSYTVNRPASGSTTYICATDRSSLTNTSHWMQTRSSTPASDWCRTSYSSYTDTVTTRTYDGGQNACADLKNIASQAKAAGITVITVAYNLQTSDKCSKGNYHSSGSLGSTVRSGGSTISSSTCVAGTSTDYPIYVASPCTYQGDLTVTINREDDNDPSIISVLNDVASPNEDAVGGVNGCSTTTMVPDPTNPTGPNIPEWEAENLDGDAFYCLKEGADSTEVTEALIRALVTVAPPETVKLMNRL